MKTVQKDIRRIVSLSTGENLCVRTGHPKDAGQLLELSTAVMKEETYMVTEPDEWDMTVEREQEWIEDYRKDPGKLLLVAEAGERVVGMLDFAAGNRRRLAHRGMLAMSVRRGWRGKGVGTSLLRSLLDWAKRHPRIEKVSLEVLATNLRAIRLYKKMGFVEEGRKIREVRYGPGNYADMLIMSKWVN